MKRVLTFDIRVSRRSKNFSMIMICNFEEKIYNTQVPCTFANILTSHKTRALDKTLFSVNGTKRKMHLLVKPRL